jgi:pimeloyl-ACP methyl ester carboxylesterase
MTPSPHPSDAPPAHALVLIHGAGGDSTVWTAQLEWFAARHRPALALELPAHGGTEGAPLASVEAMADWVLHEITARGLGKVALAGHSMGSLVALHAAATQPQRVCALALLGTAVPMRVSSRLLAQAEADPLHAIENVVRWSYAQPAPDHPPAGFQSPQQYRELLARQQAGWAGGSLLATDLAACDRYAAGEASARRWTGPTLLLLGRQDRMTPPENAATLRSALAGARTEVFDCGHNLMAEAPLAVAQALGDWLERSVDALPG